MHGGPEETEVIPALYGRLAHVATVPKATGATRKKITINDLRKDDCYLAKSDVRVLRWAKNHPIFRPEFLDKRLVQVAESLYLFDRLASSCAFVEGMVHGH